MLCIIVLKSFNLALTSMDNFYDVLFDHVPYGRELETIILKNVVIILFPNIPHEKTLENMPDLI
jgi:hypothetical protein